MQTLASERRNLLIVKRWDGTDAGDGVLQSLVDGLLNFVHDTPALDVRIHTKSVQQCLDGEESVAD